MTPEDLKKKLAELGINPDEPQWMGTKSADLGQLPLIKNQRDSLAKVKALLEAQVAGDQEQILRLQEQMARLKRGGGL